MLRFFLTPTATPHHIVSLLVKTQMILQKEDVRKCIKKSLTIVFSSPMLLWCVSIIHVCLSDKREGQCHWMPHISAKMTTELRLVRNHAWNMPLCVVGQNTTNVHVLCSEKNNPENWKKLKGITCTLFSWKPN
jgi:hypothetical protein